MNRRLKNSINKFYKKIDFRILYIFIIFILIGLFILFYKYSRFVSCEQIDFAIEAERKQVGEIIGFKDLTPGAKSWLWDFGDNSPKKYEQHPLHRYSKSGMYIVTLKVNGSCILQKTIEIKNMGKIIDSRKVPQIISPTVVTVGQPFNVYCKYSGEAFSWEWSFGESGQMDDTSEYPIYNYSEPGKKRLTLVINGDIAHIASKDIYVKPRVLNEVKETPILGFIPEKNDEDFEPKHNILPENPWVPVLKNISGVPEETPLEKEKNKIIEDQAPSISENQFKELLLEVAKQGKTKEDFSKYINNYDFSVIKNDKTIITFSELCEKIENKKIKIISLRIDRNNNNYITNINIKYKIKKGPFWIYD